MQNRRLLDRQIELLRHLTSAQLLFGEQSLPEKSCDPALRGMNAGRLRLEAEMSCRKRMGKVARILRRTWSLLGDRRSELFRDFAAACPPRSYRSYEDAALFHEFLLDRWQSVAPSPPFMVDVAKLEMALARTWLFCAAEKTGSADLPAVSWRDGVRLRCCDGVEIVDMDYDLRVVFEGEAANGAPPKRRHCLIVAPGPKIAELPEALAGIFRRSEASIAPPKPVETSRPGHADLTAPLRWFVNAGFLEIAE